MRRALLLATVVLALALAGCNVADDDGARPTPRVVSRPPTGPAPPDMALADLQLVSLAVTPNETEAGAPVEVVASVANARDLPSQASVLLEIVGGPSARVDVTVDGHAVAEARATLVPELGGSLAVRATLGSEESTTALRVRAARLANLTFAASATEPCGRVRYEAGFDNVGDGPARDVRVRLAVNATDGAPLETREGAVPDVAPASHGAWTGELAQLRAACAGEEPVAYAVRMVVRARGLLETTLTGVVTA